MKLTKSRLRQIIREEISRALLSEQPDPASQDIKSLEELDPRVNKYMYAKLQSGLNLSDDELLDDGFWFGLNYPERVDGSQIDPGLSGDDFSHRRELAAAATRAIMKSLLVSLGDPSEIDRLIPLSPNKEELIQELDPWGYAESDQNFDLVDLNGDDAAMHVQDWFWELIPSA